MKIFTLGYEGTSFEAWFDHLMSNGITCLVDIREKPISRKQGFSKNGLKAAVENAGMRYVHYKTLGSPSDIRKRLHETSDYLTFFDEYERYLDTCEEELNELRVLAQAEQICLLCFEQNHRRCHRNSVAKRLASLMPERAEIVNVDCSQPVVRKEDSNYSKNVSNT